MLQNRPGNLAWLPKSPALKPPTGGSDHKKFLQYAAIPVINFEYSLSYSLYHTLYETPYVVENILDPDFSVQFFWSEIKPKNL